MIRIETELYLPNCPYCGGKACMNLECADEYEDGGYRDSGYIVTCEIDCEAGKTYPLGPERGCLRKIDIYEFTAEDAARAWQDMVLMALLFGKGVTCG